MILNKLEGFVMLLWQPQKLPEPTKFFTKLLGVSVALHIVICLSLFFYQAGGGKITFDTKRMLGKDVIVKLVPFGQKKPVAHVSRTRVSVGGNKKTVALKKTMIALPSAKAAKKSATKKQQKKTGLVQKKVAAKKDTKLQDSKKKKKEAVKKNIQKAVPQKQAASKEATHPKEGQQQPEIKEVAKEISTKEISKEIPAQDTTSVAQVPQQALPIETPVQQPTTQELSQLGATTDAQQSMTQEILYVSQEEFADIEMQRLLSEAVTQAWHPPVGMPAQAICKALIEVDWQGVMTSYTLTETSGIMIYDVSVEEGIKALVLPRAVWGKKIELIFKPWTEE